MNKYPDFTNYGYQISKELGRNLQGGRITYLAKSLTSNRQVVIKEFRFALADGSWSAFKAYQREISALKQLKHSQIPCYLDSFETESGFCLVTEYIQAPSLAERHIFTPEEVKKIAISVLEILVYLQNFQPPIIHRDIKPENILVDKNLQVYLVDFGLAKLRGGELSLSSIAVGTPGFMPPEEMFNRPLSNGSDLYSLGATLICLLTGTKSVEVDRLLDEDYRFKFEDLVPNLHRLFTKWLTKMVELHPKRRYENAVFALQELKEVPVVGDGEIFAFPENEIKVEQKFVRREISVVGGEEIFAFPEDKARVNQEVIGVIENGEIFPSRRGEIKDNKKVFGVVGILVAIITIFGIGSMISLRNKVLVNSHTLVKSSPHIERFKRTRECGSCDLKNANLENTNLKGANLKSAWLERANLKGANLEGANLEGANLEGTNLENANLQRAYLVDADLRNTNLEGTNLENANLQRAYLVDADLRNTNLKNANLTRTTLRRTSINEQTILNPKWFLVWQITNNRYEGFNLKKADLSGGELAGVDLENVDLEGANLENTFLSGTLSGANLKNANLKNSLFQNLDLDNTDLQGANLENAEFVGKFNLRKANFEDANLANANFNITNNNPNSVDVDLEEANLKNANLENVNFTGVNLKNSNLTGANITSADFTGANLEGAIMPDGSTYNGKMDK